MKGYGIKELENLKSLSLKIQEATSKSVAITKKLVTMRTSNKKHGWIPVKYETFLHLRHFLNKLQKYYQLPLGTLDIFGPFHRKTIMPTCRNFDVYLQAKNELNF